MLQAYPDLGDCEISADQLHQEGLNGHTWIDLQDPTPEEVAEVERICGLRVPTRAELEEIELSSRIRVEKDTLYMSAPLLVRTEDGSILTAPTGFVLNKQVCLTVRFADLVAFDNVTQALKTTDHSTAPDIFARLLEEVVDRAADRLEVAADELNKASHAIFHQDEARSGKKSKLTQDTKLLRRIMTQIGRASERMSVARYTLVCISRMAQFTAERGKDWLDEAMLSRLHSVRADVASLEQYEENLLSRVQLLQDAATAFISIEQNDVVKVLTIASVVGVPPVMVVGLYGMNFKYMPELNWAWGYPYAIALIVITTLIPLAWFKWKDWM
ncbi:CorA family divalent cation transporter [Caulobacter sp. S45]|uniref:CorA family divalent cation transporter n=1 Tax=Caulobacter sp. S45 TaxID=1641861 RepID=UPI00131D1603|nr:CorA family divalent cation transporter [Caulobacter sp. S45]